MKLTFYGGAREVTGSCYLLETATKKILVDCGLFQGDRENVRANFASFQFDPKKIDMLFVTHAHLDHIGRIPKLAREGFRGKIYSTAPTRELARILLEDALDLSRRQEEQLYEESDLERAFSLWQDSSYAEKFEEDGVIVRLNDAGHILGSASIEFWAEEKHLFFSGDLGNVPSPLLAPPQTPRDIEYLIIESTYGNSTHESVEERTLKLERAVEEIAMRRGTLMIPAFATERTQDILYLLNEMIHFKRIPEIPVFVDSPLAIKATDIYEKYTGYYKDDIRELYLRHPHLFKFKRLHFTPSVEESKKINEVPSPKVVIAGSGMMTGGRILHHLRRYLSDEKSILLIVGYQAAGSLGRRLISGEHLVKILGDEVSVRAEIRLINGFSAHADNPQLFAFVESNRDTLKHVFVVQGEASKALYFSQEIKDRLGIQADVPMMNESFEI